MSQNRFILRLSNHLSELARLKDGLEDFRRRQGLSSELTLELNLALEEILTNVISYGYDDDNEHQIEIRLDVEAGQLTAEVEDDGRPFDPLQWLAPDLTAPVQQRPVGSLGIHLVRKLMDRLDYRRQGNRNLLSMQKTIGEN